MTDFGPKHPAAEHLPAPSDPVASWAGRLPLVEQVACGLGEHLLRLTVITERTLTEKTCSRIAAGLAAVLAPPARGGPGLDGLDRALTRALTDPGAEPAVEDNHRACNRLDVAARIARDTDWPAIAAHLDEARRLLAEYRGDPDLDTVAAALLSAETDLDGIPDPTTSPGG